MRHRHLIAFVVVACIFQSAEPVRAGFLFVTRDSDIPNPGASTNTVTKINTATGAQTTVANFGSTVVTGLAFDAHDNLYVTNINQGTITLISPNGISSIFASGLGNPDSLAFDSLGDLFVSDQANNSILKITPGGTVSVFASVGLSDPQQLAFDSAGNLYVANNGNNTIEKFTPTGVGSVFATTGSGPEGLAFDAAGNLYVSNEGSNTIEKFTSGGVGSLFATTGLNAPRGLAFDSVGNLYVANGPGGAGNSIEVFTPSGVGSVFNSGGDSPVQLAIEPALQIQAVPEPSTLVQFGTGSLILLARAPRQRRAKVFRTVKLWLGTRLLRLSR